MFDKCESKERSVRDGSAVGRLCLAAGYCVLSELCGWAAEGRATEGIVTLIEGRRQRTTMTSFQAAALAQSHTLKTSVRNRLNVDRLSK